MTEDVGGSPFELHSGWKAKATLYFISGTEIPLQCSEEYKTNLNLSLEDSSSQTRPLKLVKYPRPRRDLSHSPIWLARDVDQQVTI